MVLEAITDHNLKSLGTKRPILHAVMILLNMIGGRNGIGRIDMVEKIVGMKSRGIYETLEEQSVYAYHGEFNHGP